MRNELYGSVEGTSALKTEEPKVLVVNGENLSGHSARFLASEYEMFMFFEEEKAEDFLMSLSGNEMPELLVLSVGKGGNMDGVFEVVKFINEHKSIREIPFVVFSEHAGSSTREECFEKGAKDCIERGASEGELKSRISRVLNEVAARKRLEKEANRQEALAKRSAYRLAKATSQMVDALLSTIEATDSYTEGHSMRVRDAAVALAAKAGYPEEKIPWIANAALLHDIGKLGVGGNILNKPGKLDEDEFCKIRKHPEAGHKILSRIDNFHTEMDVALHHHERWDGKGYPEGKSGEDISIEARIVAIADTYDVMKTGRSYQTKKSDGDIADEIERCAGTQFDPNLAKLFSEMVRSGELERLRR